MNSTPATKTPSPAQTKAVNDALTAALAALEERKANPLLDSPLYPHRELIEKLVRAGASAQLIAHTLSTAGLEANATTVNRFVRVAKIRKTRARKTAGTTA
ncbi:MAG: hypothetical protein ABIO95_04480 [Bdellovibrionota bacterium]